MADTNCNTNITTKSDELSEKHLKWLEKVKRERVVNQRYLDDYLRSDNIPIPYSKKGTYEEESKKLKAKAFIKNEKEKAYIKYYETRERTKANNLAFTKDVWSKKLKVLNKEFFPKKTTPKTKKSS